MADETRLRILSLLLESGELCVCDLMAVLQLPQSTVSRHLSYLRNAGWVNDRRVGLWIHYSIRENRTPLQTALLPVLKSHISDSGAAAADRERLAGFAKGSSCA